MNTRDEVRRWRMWLDWFADFRDVDLELAGTAGRHASILVEDMTWGEHGELGESGA